MLFFLKTDKECLYSDGKYFITSTRDINRWIKMGFTLFQLGKAIYDKSFGDALGACLNLYNLYKTKEDGDFVQFISQPFLTSDEQDKLIKQLREADPSFFDMFRYSAQSGNWACLSCWKKEQIARGKMAAPEPTPAPSSTTTTTSSTTTSPTPSSPTSQPSKQESSPTPGSAPSSPSAPRSTLKVNIGMGPLNMATNVIAVLKDDKLIFYSDEKDEKKGKVKHELQKSKILIFDEIDERVARKKFAFKLVTSDRRYECHANNETDYTMWKKLFPTK